MYETVVAPRGGSTGSSGRWNGDGADADCSLADGDDAATAVVVVAVAVVVVDDDGGSPDCRWNNAVDGVVDGDDETDEADGTAADAGDDDDDRRSAVAACSVSRQG